MKISMQIEEYHELLDAAKAARSDERSEDRAAIAERALESEQGLRGAIQIRSDKLKEANNTYRETIKREAVIAERALEAEQGVSSRLGARIEKLRVANNTYREKIKKLDAEVSKLTASCDDARRASDGWLTSYQRASEQNRSLRKDTREVERLKACNESFRKENDRVTVECNQVRGRNAALEVRIGELRHDVSVALDTMEQVAVRNAALRDK